MYSYLSIFLSTVLLYFRSEHMTGIQKLFPNATLVYIEGAGHNPHAEKPNEFLNAVKEFIS